MNKKIVKGIIPSLLATFAIAQSISTSRDKPDAGSEMAGSKIELKLARPQTAQALANPVNSVVPDGSDPLTANQQGQLLINDPAVLSAFTFRNHMAYLINPEVPPASVFSISRLTEMPRSAQNHMHDAERAERRRRNGLACLKG